MDTIADMLIRIKNGYLAGKETVEVPFSKIKKALADLLKNEGYLESIEETNDNKTIKLKLKYKNKSASLSGVERRSKPGLRVYLDKKKIKNFRKGQLGIAIISTSKGLMTSKNALKQGLGGEFICKVW